MTRASIAEAKAKLSSLIAQVKNGEEVVLTDRGRPVARLMPIQDTVEDALLEMVKLGIARLPTGPARLPELVATSQTQIEIDREDRF